MGILLIAILLCFIGANIYIFVRALQTMKTAPPVVKIIFGVIYWLLGTQLFIVIAMRHSSLPDFIPRIMFISGTAWLVFVLYMTLALIVADIIKNLFAPSMKYGTLWALGITVAILTGGYINNLNPKIETIDIKLDKPLKEPIKIVAVSDLHLGYGTGKDKLKKFVKIINAQEPDLIIIGGDLIDNSIIPLYHENMDEELRELKAPMGIYMAPGNHEYISGIDKCYTFLKCTPIKMLVDSVVKLPNNLQLVLRNDYGPGDRNKSLESIMKETDKNLPIMIVKHQPNNLEKKDKEGADIVFCGHTHHGQIWPGNIVTDLLFKQSHGYRKWENAHIFVSSGLSLWGPPVRIGTKSDIAVFNISSNN